MRHSTITKFALFLFVGATFMLTSCSKDDDNSPTPPDGDDPQGENTAPFEPVLFERNLELPAAINSSNDPKVLELKSHFGIVTSFSEDAGDFEIPEGAVVTHEPVQTGRSMDPDYTVYTYTSGDYTIVYQFSQQNGYDVLEVFVDLAGDEVSLLKYYEIRQSFDDTNGTMTWFVGQDSPVFLWTWEINADESIFITLEFTASRHYEMMLYPDDSGYLEIYNGEGALLWEWTWTSDGHGTWADHQNGESGNW